MSGYAALLDEIPEHWPTCADEGTPQAGIPSSIGRDPLPHTASYDPDLLVRVKGYLDAITEVCNRDGGGLVSIVVFVSAAKGDFSRHVSDVDLIVEVPVTRAFGE